MNLNKLKQANQIYESLAEITPVEAINELNTYENLDHEVLNLVKSLINNSQQSSAFFEQKVSQHYQSPLNKTWQVGDQIGDYELLELIGQGGMSMVYKAQRSQSDKQKPVAIKLFNLANQNPELTAKFKAEQNILAELSHPNVIEFHHAENSIQGDSYIVMELIDGGLPIDEYVSTKQLNNKQIVTLLLQAAEALQYAHQHLIIHRDVKPSNIMVNQNGQLKVLDFGIAKLIIPDIEVNAEEQAQHTLMALTPSFASPEQINATGIDVTTDVFSLAAVTVYLLTQQQPFPANRMLKSCAEDEAYIRKQLKEHIQDQDLRNLLTCALHQDRKYRYANMFAFSEDLNAWLAHKPVSASKDTWWYRINRLAHRRTALFVTSLVLLITVVAAIVILSLQNQAIKLEAQKADAVKQFMLDSFSVTDPNVSQGVDLSAKDLLRIAADKMTFADDMDPVIKFELYVALAIANGRLGYYPEAIILLNEALIIQPKNEQSTALLAQYLFNAGEIETVNELLNKTQEDDYTSVTEKAAVKRVRANVLAQAGNYKQAFIQFKSLKALAVTQMDTINNQALLAELYYLKGDSERSIAILQELKSMHPMAATDVLNLSLNSDLVQYHDQVGNYGAALALTEENIKAYREILGDEHPNLGLAYNALSVFQRLNGQLDDALTSAELSAQIFRKRYGSRSEGLAQALGNAGVAYYYQKQNTLAIKKLSQAADMLQTIFGDNHPETMDAKFNLATILNATGNPQKALPILQKIYQVEMETVGENHRSVIYTKESLALTLAKTGQFESAILHAQESIALSQENFPNQSDLINHAHSILGRVYYMAGNHESAIFQNLLHINGWTEGNENNYARSLQLVAGSYHVLQKLDQAAEYYQKWTNHLFKIYGVADDKYLQGLLDWAEASRQMNHLDQANTLLTQVQSILTEYDLSLPEVQAKLKELSH